MIFSQMVPSIGKVYVQALRIFFFHSLIYSTMFSENVWPERLSHTHFINRLEKIGKGVGVMLHFLFHLG